MPAVTSTNPKKNMGTMQNQQLPYVQNNQMLPIKNFTAPQLEQGSQNVMGTAQQTAIQKATQPNLTMGLVQQQTQKMMQEPELITDKYIKNRLDTYNRERANQMSAFQQLYADTANTGTTREAAYNFAMQGAQGRTDLENELLQDQAIKNREAKLQALNLGMTTAKTGSELDTEAFNRLISARGAYEGERAQTSAQGFGKEMTAIDQANKLEYLKADQAGQMALTELQGKIQQNQLLTQQDFVASQSALDRALEDAKMKGDWANAENITKLKGQIESQAQKAQQDWLSVQNSLDRASQESLTKLKGDIDKGLLLTEQDFLETQNSLNRALEDAKMKGDWANAEKITTLKGQIDAQAQKAQQDWLSVQNSLDRDSQVTLTKLKGDIEKGILLTQQDFVESQSALDRALEDAKMKGDWANAEKITTLKGKIDAQAQESQQEWMSYQNALDRDSKEYLTKLQGDIQKGLLLTEQDFQGTQASLDRALKDAQMKGDWENAEKITTLKGKIDAQAQQAQQEWMSNQNALDRENQTALTNLKGEIEKGLLVESNKFSEIQNGLNRDLERYKASGDWANAEKITKLKGQIDAQAQQAQQDWATSERIATQSWSTDERLSDQQFNRATQYLDQQHALAMQNNDINATKQIEKQRMDLQLTMQLQDFSHDEKMANINAAIDEAKANNDVGRQKQLMSYQTLLNLNEMEKEQGYKVAQMNLQKDIETALQNNQHANAMSMLDAQQEFAAKEAEKDRVLEKVRIELQKRGIDMAEQEQTYNQMAKENPDDAFKYLQGELNKKGIKLDKAEEDANLQAIADDYRQQQFVYALSHPDQAVWVDANGNQVAKGAPGSKFGGLKDDAAKTFNDFLNTSYYGPDGKIQAGGKPINSQNSDIYTVNGINGTTKLYNKATNKELSPDELGIALRGAQNDGNQNNATYQKMLNEASVPDIRINSKSSNTLSGVPPVNSIINVGGRLMVITQGPYREKTGRNKDAFQIMDVGTGAKKTFNGLSQGDDSVLNLGNWAAELP